MAYDVPWLTTPGEQLGAMERGASLGLARRAQDTNEREAMQRLQLAYNQMAMQEQDRQRAQAIAAQRQQAADALRMINQQRMFLSEQRAADAANRPPKRDIRSVGGGLYDVTDPTKVNPLIVPPEKPDKAKSDALQREEFKSALARVSAARKELAVLSPDSPRRTRWEKELSDALDDVERLKGSGAASALEKAPINVTTPKYRKDSICSAQWANHRNKWAG
jgi:hypothetical protein